MTGLRIAPCLPAGRDCGLRIKNFLGRVTGHGSRVTLFLLFVLAGLVHASDAGKAGAQFLKIGPGARPMAMGGAFGGVQGDLYGMYWNPSGIGSMTKKEISTTYIKYFQGVDYGFLGYVHPTQVGSFGLGITYLTLDGIEGRTGDTLVADREFGARDMAVGVTYGKAGIPGISEDLSLGITGKMISMKIDSEDATSGALDLGLGYKSPWEGFTMGVTLKNLGTQVKFIEESDPLPLQLKLGLAYQMNKSILMTADANHHLTEEKLTGGLGFEYSLKALALRAGYQFGEDRENLGAIVGMTAGMGINLYGMSLDYGFVPYGDLGDTHRVTFGVKF